MPDQGLGSTFADLWQNYAPEPFRTAGTMAYGMAGIPQRVMQAAANMPPPGARREDYTDIPGNTQPLDASIPAVMEGAGLAMTGGAGGVPATAGEMVLGAGPARKLRYAAEPSAVKLGVDAHLSRPARDRVDCGRARRARRHGDETIVGRIAR